MTLIDFSKALLALVSWREARGEPDDGLRAVMHVIKNRVTAGWGDWIHVITARNQFTSISVPSDPEVTLWPASTDMQFQKILSMVDDLFEEDPDPTNGALYYENPSVARSAWFQNNVVDKLQVKATIGRHIFYG